MVRFYMFCVNFYMFWDLLLCDLLYVMLLYVIMSCYDCMSCYVWYVM